MNKAAKNDSKPARLLTTVILSLSLICFLFFPETKAARSVDYQSLTPNELVAEADRIAEASGEVSAEKAEALSARALALLWAADGAKSVASDTWSRLVDLAKPRLKSLSRDQREELATKLLSASDYVSGLTFEELRSQVALKKTIAGASTPTARLIENWLSDRDFNGLSLTELAWCLQHTLPNDTERKEFSVTWSGFLTPPHSGTYDFSVSPINVNSTGRLSVEHSITLSLGGKEILNTTPKPPEDEQPSVASRRSRRRRLQPTPAEWHWQGEPIELEAGVPVPLQVVMKYRTSEINEAHSPSAMLFWEGPAVDRQAVPAQVLSGPTGNGELRAEYRWSTKAGEKVVVQENSNIQFAWSTPARVAPANGPLTTRLTDELFELATDPAYLDDCAAGRSMHIYFENVSSTEYLSHSQRQQFLDLLLSRPDLLDRISQQQIVPLYRRFRFGSEEESLELLGHWMQLRPDITPHISTNFFRDNRQPYWELAQLLALQLPEQCQQLQDRYLETQDGRCALPVAYTLSYAYFTQARLTLPAPGQRERPVSAFDEWVQYLTDTLADDSLSGNHRVNWLLARAQSGQIRFFRSSSFPVNSEPLLKGKQWLQEAILVSESEPMLYRAHNELISRAIATNSFEYAELLISQADAELTSPASKVHVASWDSALVKAKEDSKRRIQQSEQRAVQAHLGVIRRRQTKALTRGDKLAASRYDAMLSAFEE